MKVLWFVNIQMPDYLCHAGLLGTNSGGWMGALLTNLRGMHPECDLAVAFAGAKNDYSKINGVEYYCIKHGSITERSMEIVEAVKPTIIHLHGSDGISLLLDERIFKFAPVVLSIQGVLSGYWPHFMGGLSVGELNSRRNYLRDMIGYRRITQEADYWRCERAKQEEFVFSRSVACLGRTMWDRAWASILAPKARYFHVGEIMRGPFYKGIRDGNKVKKHLIYCSAALTYPLKGGHWLLRAIAALKGKYPDIKLRVANAYRIVDDRGLKKHFGKSEYYRYIESLTEQLGINGNVELLPSLNEKQVRDELECAEIFCLPSLVENSPNSLGEAMLTGVPAIATNVGGISSMLTDKEDGILVPSGDYAMLAMAIDELFSNPEKAKAYAIAGYNKAVKQHSPTRVIDELMVAYNEVVNPCASC